MSIPSAPAPESVYRSLVAIPDRIGDAWAAAKADPDHAAEILADLQHEARRATGVAAITLREWVKTGTARNVARERSIERAERRYLNLVASSHTSALAESIEPSGFYVYCLWGDDPDRPIYVGRSSNVLSRLGSHLSSRLRRRMVRRVTLTKLNTYRQMCDHEARLIRHYQPALNVVGVDRAVG